MNYTGAMRNRILDFSQQGGYLKLQLDNLVLEREGDEVARIPMEDIAVLVLAHPALVMTQSVLSSLLEHNGMLLICGVNKMPLGMVMPFQANYLHTERFRHQVEASKPLRKRLWQQIIKTEQPSTISRGVHEGSISNRLSSATGSPS